MTDRTTRRIHLASTALLAGLMLLSGSGNLLRLEAFAQNLRSLGYPQYLLGVLGVAKLLGVLALLYGARAPRLREWAYAGFAFDFGGAVASQLLAGLGLRAALSPALCGLLLAASYLTATKRGESARHLYSAAPEPAHQAGAPRAGS